MLINFHDEPDELLANTNDVFILFKTLSIYNINTMLITITTIPTTII